MVFWVVLRYDILAPPLLLPPTLSTFSLAAAWGRRRQMAPVTAFGSELDRINRENLKLHGKDLLDTQVEKVEVSWNGRIELLSFRRPPEADYLAATTKADFMSVVDLRTAGKKALLLLEK